MTILVVVVAVLSLLLGDDDAPSLYAEDVRGQAERVARLVGPFQSLILELSETDRVLLNDTIDEVTSTLQAARTHTVETPAPAAASDVPVVLDLALSAWIDGLEKFRSGMLAAADEVFPTPVENQIIDAFVDLQVGDRLYAQAVERLAAADIPPPVSPMPSIVFFPSSFPMAGTANTLVAYARTENGPLELRAVLEIEQVATEPEWIVDVTEALVIENTSSVIVKVVVSNNGNTISEPTTVGLELVSTDGSLQTRVLDVPALEAGETTTLSTDQLDVAPGVLYELLVGMPIADPNVEDPALGRSFEFRINDEVSPTTTTVPTETSEG